MTNANPAPEADFNVLVANNIRAELARERWTGRKAAAALGLNPMYISRRLNGETPMDPNDLVMFARLLRVPVATFFADNKKGPATEVTGPNLLLDRDSNAEPAGAWSAPETMVPDQLEHHRRAKLSAHHAVAADHEAIITSIRKVAN